MKAEFKPGQTRQVFLSHIRKEIRLAEAVAEALGGQECEVWLDRYDLERGESWEQEITRALDESDSMIALLGPYAYSSSLVRRELQYALFEDRFKNRLLPVLIGGTSVEGFSQLPWILTRIQHLRIDPNQPETESAGVIVEAFLNLLGSSQSSS